MIEYKKVFFSILKSALWGTSFEVPHGFKEWREVCTLARSQSVLGLVANFILNAPELNQLLSDDLKLKLKRFVIGNFSTSQMLNNALLKVVQALREHGIDPVLLKGQGIAKYYPVPELRQCGDIDIYVGAKNFEKSCEVIGALSTPEDHTGDIPSLKHFHTKLGPASIEIHRYTDVYFPKRLDRIYQKISDDGMNSGQVVLDFSGVPVLTPSIDFNVFFIFNHFWHHFIADGVGLRQICDWALLLYHNQGKINLQYLESVLKQMRLFKEWKVFGYIAVNSLGLPAEEMPFYDPKCSKLAAMVLDLIMLEGNFGQENMKGHNRPKGYYAGKWYSFRKRFVRNLRVLRIFPIEALRHLSKVFFIGVAVIFSDKFKLYQD